MAKEIILKSLALKNFKGIKDLHIDFSKITNIFGENASGKTTVFDAFTWLLFDKDSQDRTSFEIKTLDISNNVLHGLEHLVTGVLTVDGKTITLSKIYKEKWTKKRGEAEKELTGHETLYYVDEDPVKKGEYQEKISSLINEQLFKLISNPLYFSTNMKWQDRRKVLLDIIGDITTDRIINYRNDLRAIEKLLEDKDVDTLKKSLQAKRKRFNDEIKAIPIRIDEANNSIQELDFDAFEFRKRGIISGIKSLEEQLLDSSKVNEEVLKEKDKLYKLKSNLQQLEYAARSEINKPLRDIEIKASDHRSEISQLNNEKLNKERLKKRYEEDTENITKEMDMLRNQFVEINGESLDIDEHLFVCPTCKREFETDDIERKKQEITENFNVNKAMRLKQIQDKGIGYKKEVEQLNTKIGLLEEEIRSLELKLAAERTSLSDLEKFKAEFKPVLIESEEMKELKEQIQELETKLSKPIEITQVIAELKERKRNLEIELEQVNKDLSYKERNEELKTRIQELQDEEKKLGQQIAALEGQEFLCEEFIKTKVELLESSINSKFKYVSFKLFDTQVNGGLNETCEALINGVPFSNANTASQINAGLDIINALCSFYGVQAPIFIDNRESINQLIETDSQVINLIVSTDKELKVEREEM